MRINGLTSYHFKLLAAATMLVDHTGAILYPDTGWLRMVGRISFPLFIWLLVQGEIYTKDIWRYGLRLGLLGLISQPIYQWVFDTRQLNILFQLLVGLMCLRLDRAYPLSRPWIWLIAAVITEASGISYGSYGIALILLIRYFQPQNGIWWFAWIGFHALWTWLAGPFQLPAIVIPLLLLGANGQRGPQARWFYGFYPAHLALLGIIHWYQVNSY